jgi:hypothetical protein
MFLAELDLAEAMEMIYLETKHDIFLKLFQFDVPLELIRKVTGLSLKEIRLLIEKNFFEGDRL